MSVLPGVIYGWVHLRNYPNNHPFPHAKQRPSLPLKEQSVPNWLTVDKQKSCWVGNPIILFDNERSSTYLIYYLSAYVLYVGTVLLL